MPRPRHHTRSSTSPKETSGEFSVERSESVFAPAPGFRVLLASHDPAEVMALRTLAARHEALRDGMWCAGSLDEVRVRLATGVDDVCVLRWAPGHAAVMEVVRAAGLHNWPVPLVVVSATEDPAAEREAMGAGVSEWLVRAQLTVEDLERAVRNTVRRAAVNRSLRDRERTFRAAFEGGGEARLLVDDEGRCTDANEVARRVFALGEGELIDLDLTALLGPAVRDRLAAMWADREVREETFRVPGVGGATVMWEANVVPCILPDCHLVVLRDVTHREEMRQRLALTERMLSLGTLASGMAHAINNPLQTLYASMDLMQQHLARAREGGPEAVPPSLTLALAELAAARDASERVQRVVRDLAVFTRTDRGEMTRVNLLAPLETAIRLTANTIRHRATLVKDLRPLASVMGNEAQLTQVFVHLLLNAAQALPEGAASSHEVRVSMGPADDGRVQVTVSDTGHGMSPEVVGRVFDPFFTTRPVGVGSGLGLSVCHGTVASMGGEILVESELGRGSTFRVLFPALPVTARPSAMTPVNPIAPVLRAKVLVIDDDPMVCRSLTRLLQGHHEVEALSNAVDALARVRAGERWDAILCDVMMPEMSGVDFYRELQREAPDVAARVVFVTGGVFSQEARAFLDEGKHRVVDKPVTQSALFHALQRVLPRHDD